jgi:hypothetical protein
LNRDEQIAKEYLEHRGFHGVVFEPEGKSTALGEAVETLRQTLSAWSQGGHQPISTERITTIVLIRLTPQTPRDSVGRDAPGVSSVVA